MARDPDYLIPPGRSGRRRRRRAPVAALALVVGVALVAAGAAIWPHVAGRAVAAGASGPAVSSPGPIPSASLSTPTPSASPPPRVVSIVAVGDTMLGNTPALPPDPGTYLAGVRSVLRAPVVFGNLEGTLTNRGVSKCAGSVAGPASPAASAAAASSCYAFRDPPSYARILRADGFRVLNSANNHSMDFGPVGMSDTTAALRAAGIRQTGLAGQIAIVRTSGVSVAFVGFAPYPWTSPLLDLPAARTLIRKAHREASVVVVYMHAGAEGAGAAHVTGHEEYFLGEDRGNPEAFAHMAVRAGADLVIASGPHVLRGMEFYRDRLVAYSLGDFAGYGDFSTAGVLGLSAALRVRLSASGRFLSARVVSLRLVGQGQPVVDPSGAAARVIAGLSRQDFGAAAVQIARDGRITPRA